MDTNLSQRRESRARPIVRERILEELLSITMPREDKHTQNFGPRRHSLNVDYLSPASLELTRVKLCGKVESGRMDWAQGRVSARGQGGV